MNAHELQGCGRRTGAVVQHGGEDRGVRLAVIKDEGMSCLG